MTCKRFVYLPILFLIIISPILFSQESITIGKGSHPTPKIVIENIPSELKRFQLFTIRVLLENNGEESLRRDWAVGVHLRLSNASFIRVEKGDFKELITFSLQNNNVSESPIVGSNIVELWTDFISSNKSLKSGEICILVSDNATNVSLNYRAWIMDRDDEVHCDLHDRFEPYILRDPLDVTDDRFNGLKYFLFYKTYEVLILVNGLNAKDEIDTCTISISVNPLGHADINYNFIYVCKSPEKELRIWIHAPTAKLDLGEYLGFVLPIMTKTIPINVTEIQASRQANGRFVNDVGIQRDGSWLVLVIANHSSVELLSLSFRLMNYVNTDSVFYELGFVIFSPNSVLVHSLDITSSIQFSYGINSHIEYAILTHYLQKEWYQQSLKLPDRVRFINRVIDADWHVTNFSDEIGVFVYASNLYIVGSWGRPVFWLFMWGCIASFALISFLSLIRKGLSIELNSYLICFIIIAVSLKMVGIPYIDIISALLLSMVPAFLLYLILYGLQALSINVTQTIFYFSEERLKTRLENIFDRLQLKKRSKWVSQIISSLLTAMICFPLVLLGYFWLRPSPMPVLTQIIIISVLALCMIIYGSLYLYLQELGIKPSIRSELERLKRELKNLEEKIDSTESRSRK